MTLADLRALWALLAVLLAAMVADRSDLAFLAFAALPWVAGAAVLLARRRGEAVAAMYPESLLLGLARPVVRSGAALHADLAAWVNSLEQHFQPVLPREPPAPERLFFTVYAVDLKHVLCQINPNANKLHSGLLLSIDWWEPRPVWHFDAD